MENPHRPPAMLSVNHDALAYFTRAVESYEFDEAFRCIYHCYLARGLTPLNQLEMRLTRHHLLPMTRVLIARTRRQVVGTLTLVENGVHGLPMGAAFGPEIHGLTRHEPRIAEATCFAARGSSNDGFELVHRLIGLAAQSAARRNVSRILIAVHPRHVGFYTRKVGFRVVAGPRPYPSVGGHPAVALVLDLRTLKSDRSDLHNRYFGMRYSPSALSTDPVPGFHVKRFAALWQKLQTEACVDEAGVRSVPVPLAA